MPQKVIMVLIVDDSAATRNLLQLLLDETCFSDYMIKAIAVKDLLQAKEALTQQAFDVIAADLMLTDSTGIATFRALYACANGIPIIVVSGLDDPDMIFMIIAEGAADYVVKGSMDSKALSHRIMLAVARRMSNASH